jgi:AmmeMemoRadiSam system protein B/AmmeMemoRadiSam system protein A
MQHASSRNPGAPALKAGAVLVGTLVALGCRGGLPARAAEDVRPPVQAGGFYPADAGKLQGAVDAFLKDAAPARAGRPIALVVPHAGYIYSGQIAADGYAQVAGQAYDTVAILGTNHTQAGFDKVGVSPATGFRTPLGVALVDADLVRALLAECRDCVLDAAVHQSEHSIEVQLPFVQRLLPAAKILPVVVGSDDPAVCRRFGGALAKVLTGRKALIVASSDLSHYPSADDADNVDRALLDAIASLDGDKVRSTINAWMRRGIGGLSTCACGEAPILAALAAAKVLGATRGVVLSYANSGRMSVGVGGGGGSGRVVGYGAVALTASEIAPGAQAETGRPTPGTGEPIGVAERRQLLAFARETLAGALGTETLPIPRGLSPRLWQRQGVFVTLKKHGDLRGCIGRIPPEEPLAPLVGAMALAAAFQDPRFKPVQPEELKSIEIEISALTPPKRVARPEQIVVGRDGVVLSKGLNTAVYLPQVATEQGWNRDQMLDSLCEKAGLRAGCWKEGASFSVFQAEVFHE